MVIVSLLSKGICALQVAQLSDVAIPRSADSSPPPEIQQFQNGGALRILDPPMEGFEPV